jgi:DNA-binding NtrC family response regulator
MIARSDSVALIQGETGTGKEVIASAIHNQSSRRLDECSLIIYIIMVSSILYFHRKTTGAALISSKY